MATPATTQERAAALRRARAELAEHGIGGRLLETLLARVDEMIVDLREVDDPAVVRKCTACRMQFSLDAGERRFYERQGWGYPRRCAACRQHRRQSERHSEEQVP